jgi:hypothetical protein
MKKLLLLFIALFPAAHANELEDRVREANDLVEVHLDDVRYNGVSFLAVASRENKDGFTATAQSRRAAEVCGFLGFKRPTASTIRWLK